MTLKNETERAIQDLPYRQQQAAAAPQQLQPVIEWLLADQKWLLLEMKAADEAGR